MLRPCSPRRRPWTASVLPRGHPALLRPWSHHHHHRRRPTPAPCCWRALRLPPRTPPSHRCRQRSLTQTPRRLKCVGPRVLGEAGRGRGERERERDARGESTQTCVSHTCVSWSRSFIAEQHMKDTQHRKATTPRVPSPTHTHGMKVPKVDAPMLMADSVMRRGRPTTAAPPPPGAPPEAPPEA